MTAATQPAPESTPDAGRVGAPLRLVVSCADQPGIVAAVSQHLFSAGANIVRSDQFSTDPVGGQFFMRLEFSLPEAQRESFAEQFGLHVAERFGMTWRLWDSAKPKKISVYVSKYDHCLHDLIYRWRRDELGGEIVQVVSNHEDLRAEVEAVGLPYIYIPVTKDTKKEAEAKQLEATRGTCDFVVLARYMQIVTESFIDQVGVPIINIHHSFLPAFEGAGPYERAKERGVKLVGATAHYVTPDLDAGPIIEQDVVRVTHADTVEDLIRMGAEVERTVLARAVQWHCADRVIRYGNSTVVF